MAGELRKDALQKSESGQGRQGSVVVNYGLQVACCAALAGRRAGTQCSIEMEGR